MSGVEALALVSIVASLLQLVDFSSRAFARIKECKDDISQLPRAFLTLQNQMPLISHSLKVTWKQAQADELDEPSCQALRLVIEDCHSSASELKRILEKVSSPIQDAGWKRNLKALLSCFHDKEVAVIEATLSRSLTVINQYHGAYTAATTGAILRKLTAAVESIPGLPSYSEHVPRRHFMVPSSWSDDFIGRADTMTHLENMVCMEDKYSRVAIVGLGGVGKTRVMFEYAYRFKDSDCHSIFWIHASSRARTNKACLEIAKNTKIPGWDDPKTDKIELVSAWLDSPQSGKWILLVDNADDYNLLFGTGKLVKSFPKSSNGTIMMTTRDARFGMEFARKAVIMLGALSLEETITLVDTRLGLAENKIADITELGEELCGIPLAIVQACSFIAQNFLSIKSYLELYRASDRDKIELLSEDFEDEVRDSEILNPVAATWSITFDHILKNDILAAEVLSTMSVLDSQAIPESLLNGSIQKVKFSKAVGTLQAFVLISTRTDGPVWDGRQERLFDLHRLVRLAMRSWLGLNGQLESYTARTLKNLSQRFCDGQWETRDKWSTYLPHAAVLLASEQLAHLEHLVTAPVLHEEDYETVSHEPEDLVCPVSAANILAILATCHHTVGRPKISLEEAERAYRLRKQFLGDNHPDTITALDLISRPAKDMYLFPRAVETCTLAIKAKSETLGREHPSTLTSMATLGIIYRPMGMLKEAKEIGSLVLKNRRRILGDTDPATLTSLAYVATAVRASGDYVEAVKLETEKLQAWSTLRGLSHPEALESMAGLGWALACQGEYSRAYQLISQSVDQQLELRGPRHWYTLWSMSVMAVILGMQGKYFEAEELGERVLTLRTRELMSSHPFCYVSKLYLAWLYNETGRLKKAEDVELEVLHFQKQFYSSESHNDVLHTKSQLASTYTFMGRHQEAHLVKKEVLRLRRELSGPNHPVTLRCMSTLGLTCLDLGDETEAEVLLWDAWKSQKTVLGAEHPETITTMTRVGRLLERQSNRSEAGRMYREAIDLSIKSLGKDHPRTETRVADLLRFDTARKISETRFLSHPVGRDLKRLHSVDIQGLTIIEESEPGLKIV